jgi:hypothetical protein
MNSPVYDTFAPAVRRPLQAAAAEKRNGTAAPAPGSAALDNMKIRCFQTATEFVARGEYQQALDQIRYVVEIEPSNPIVRDFERKVVALALSRGETGETRARGDVAEESDAPTRELLPKWVLAAVVVLVVLLAGVTGFYFAWREASPGGPHVTLVE